MFVLMRASSIYVIILFEVISVLQKYRSQCILTLYQLRYLTVNLSLPYFLQYILRIFFYSIVHETYMHFPSR